MNAADFPVAVQRSCEAALLAESAINAGHVWTIAGLVGGLYEVDVSPPATDVVARPGESPAVALARIYAEATAAAMAGFLTEMVVTLALSLVGHAEATGRSTEEVAADLLERARQIGASDG